MHQLLLQKIIESVRLRISQGDCPIEKAQSVEMLEHALESCADERDAARRATFGELASAIKKFAPDLASELVERFRVADGTNLLAELLRQT